MLDLSTDTTVTGMPILTPDYASPEQVTGAGATTATDIYSLGAVLYKLLTGSSPHRFENGSMEAIVSAICKGTPTRPAKFSRALRGDLEAILLKALRKEPEERYATVEQFSLDLESYLASHPLSARNGESWYRARKFLRRHWVSAAVAGFAVASLATGLYIANRQRAIAEHRFEQLRYLSRRMIDLDGEIRTLPGSVQGIARSWWRHRLNTWRASSRQAQEDVALAQETADGYWRMGRIQGVDSEFNLGDRQSAEESLKKANLLIEGVLRSRPADRNALLRSAVVADDLMILADNNGRREEAIAQARKATERTDAFLAAPDTGEPVKLEGFLRRGGDPRTAATGLYSNVALGLVKQHLYEAAARSARKAAAVSESLPEASDLRAGALSVLANALRYEGDLDGSLKAIREARQVSAHATYASETARFFNLYALLHREALILGEADAVNLGRPDEAIQLFQQALDMAEDAAGKNPKDSGTRSRLGATATEMGSVLSERDPKRALQVFDLGIGRLEESGDSAGTRRDLATILAKSTYPLRRRGRLADAEHRLDRALKILHDTKEYPSSRIRLGTPAYWVVCALADYESATGNSHRAIELYEQLLGQVMASKPEPLTDLRDAPKMSRIYDGLIGLYTRAGNLDKAYVIRSKRDELWKHWQASLPGNPFVHQKLSASAGPSKTILISVR